MTVEKAVFIRNIEEAIKEQGTLACPNLDCNEFITSRELEFQSGKKVIKYQCTNASCSYHEVGTIPICGPRNIVRENPIQSNSFASIRKNINLGVGILLPLLLIIVGVFFVFQQFNFAEKQVFVSNEKIKPSPEKILAKKITPPNKILVSSDPSIPTTAKKEALNYNSKKELIPQQFIINTIKYINSGDFSKAKNQFAFCLDNENIKNSLLHQDKQKDRVQLLELIANSYEKYQKRFTYELLKGKNEFELLENFLKVFDLEKTKMHLYLAKAYYNLPNYLEDKVSPRRMKKMQLIALRHYLLAAQNQQEGFANIYSLEAINDILNTYKIFKFKQNLKEDFVKIEDIFDQNNQVLLQARIDWISKVIEVI